MKSLTKHQVEVMRCVRLGGIDGDLDFDQLLDVLNWEPSKEAAQFVIRAVCKKGLLAKMPELELRRGRKRVCYRLTPEGLQALDPRSHPATEKPEFIKVEIPSSGALEEQVSGRLEIEEKEWIPESSLIEIEAD